MQACLSEWHCCLFYVNSEPLYALKGRERGPSYLNSNGPSRAVLHELPIGAPAAAGASLQSEDSTYRYLAIGIRRWAGR